MTRVIHVAHSPDSDDAFMFYALAEGLIETDGIRYVHELQDIETLNQRALRAELEVTAVSIHAYASLTDRYALLTSGASMGDRYGPRLVSRTPGTRADVRGKRIAIPGPLTSAYLALKLYEPDFTPVFTPFDLIEDAVVNGDVDLGLLIHEGQLTFGDRGLHLIVDTGEWWFQETGLPLPLGGNVIRKDLGLPLMQTISRHLRASIAYGLEHRQDALNHAMRFARGLERSKADTFVGMYVNDWTLDYGDRGRRAIRELLGRGVAAGIIPRSVTVEFVEDAPAPAATPAPRPANRTPAATRISHMFDAISEPVARRVLVLDDEDSIRNAIGKFLKARGYDVAVAENGLEALDRLQRDRFDALICDVRMPGMLGTEVVPRALELRPDLAVLMLTAVNDAPTATEVLSHGAMDYLMKPVELDDLAKAVERALRKRDLEIQQRNVERMIREEVALHTEELRREQAMLAEISISIVRALVNAQEAKDPFLRGHSQRVAAMAAAIASAMGLPDDTVEDIRLSGQLHDVGKIGIPEALLHKAGPLTEEEYLRVKDHVRIGIDILTPLAPLARMLPAIQDHHERWDGSGYPRQLAGEQISLGGRILAAVDAFDALTSRRAYRAPLTPNETIDLLSSTAGAHLDPTVVEALRRTVLGRTSLHFIDEAR